MTAFERLADNVDDRDPDSLREFLAALFNVSEDQVGLEMSPDGERVQIEVRRNERIADA